MCLIRIQTSAAFFLFCAFVLASCKKTAFYDDLCTGDCYILSGTVTEYGTGLPVQNAEVWLKSAGTMFITEIVRTSTDENGEWRMSFDADYAELEGETVVFQHQEHLRHEVSVDFTKEEINSEIILSPILYKAGKVFYDLTISDPEVLQVKSVFDFNGEAFEIRTATNGNRPLKTTLSQNVPADFNIGVALYKHAESGSGIQTGWEKIAGFPLQMNVEPGETDTVQVSF